MSQDQYVDPVVRRVWRLMDQGLSREQAMNEAYEEWQNELHGEGDWDGFRR